MREQRLRRFGHVERMDDEGAQVNSNKFVVVMAQRKVDLRKDGKKK